MADLTTADMVIIFLLMLLIVIILNIGDIGGNWN